MGRIIILRLLDSYFRHRWLYLFPIVLMTILGVVNFLTQERLYMSSGVIFSYQNSFLASLTSVQNEGFSWNTPAQDTTNQLNDLIRTDAFVRAVIQETGLEAEMSKGNEVVEETITEVRKRLWVAVAGINQVQVTAANPDALIAYQLAQAMLNTFIQWKINSDRIESVAAGLFFQDLIRQYKFEHAEAKQALKRYLEAHPQPARGDRPDIEQLEIENLQADLIFRGTRLSDALNKAENARLAEIQAESNVHQMYTVVDAPDLPDKLAVSRRQMAMDAAVFLVVGAILSGIAVWGATILDRSFRIPLHVWHELDLPVLALVPDVPAKKERPRRLERKLRVKTRIPETTTESLEQTPDMPGLQELSSIYKPSKR